MYNFTISFLIFVCFLSLLLGNQLIGLREGHSRPIKIARACEAGKSFAVVTLALRTLIEKFKI